MQFFYTGSALFGRSCRTYLSTPDDFCALIAMTQRYQHLLPSLEGREQHRIPPRPKPRIYLHPWPLLLGEPDPGKFSDSFKQTYYIYSNIIQVQHSFLCCWLFGTPLPADNASRGHKTHAWIRQCKATQTHWTPALQCCFPCLKAESASTKQRSMNNTNIINRTRGLKTVVRKSIKDMPE